MKKPRAVDIRTIRTKKAIANAVEESLLTMERDKISIKIIAEKANISRKTFYFYYKSVDEVLTAIQAEFIERLCEIVETTIYEINQDAPAKLFTRLNELFFDKADLYLKLCSFKDANFEEGILQVLKTQIIKNMKEKNQYVPEHEIILDFVLSGMLYVYSSWLRSDRSTPISEMSYILGKLVMNGISGIRLL